MYWQLLFLRRVTVNFPVSLFVPRHILQLGRRRSSAGVGPTLEAGRDPTQSTGIVNGEMIRNVIEQDSKTRVIGVRLESISFQDSSTNTFLHNRQKSIGQSLGCHLA